jgi:hypothetical protein
VRARYNVKDSEPSILSIAIVQEVLRFHARLAVVVDEIAGINVVGV